MYTHPASPDCDPQRRVIVMWAFPRRHACLFQPILCDFTPTPLPTSSIDELHNLPHLDQKECQRRTQRQGEQKSPNP
jgi:hypothetical protein